MKHRIYAFLLLALALCPFASGAYLGGGQATANPAYTGVETIVIQGSQVSPVNSTTLSNFPVLISGTYSYLKTTANSGYIQNTTTLNTQTVPADLIFTTDSACSAKLNWEIASYTATSGKIEAWVDITSLPHSTNTTIYMCYGNIGVTTYQGNATSVWDSNYIGVYHLANGTTLSARDSTANGNNGGIVGSSAISGQIDGAASFTGVGSSSYVTLPITSGYSNFTLEAIVNFTAEAGSGVNWPLAAFDNLGNYTPYGIGRNTNATILCGFNNSSGTSYNTSSTATIATGSWQWVAETLSGTTLQPWVNGAASGTPTTITGSPTTSGGTLTLGRAGNYTSNEAWNGGVDEVRLSQTARSADWIATEYNNQSSPSTFYTITP